MLTVTAYLVDAFTAKPSQGNRAGVVLDADGLSQEQMQEIARIVNVSETAFVISDNDPECDFRVRYFTPTREVPICGHATIATHWLRANILNLPTTELKVKTGVGILPVNIERRANEVYITMTQGRPVLDPALSEDICSDIADALNLRRDDFVDSLPIQIASTGHSKVMIPLNSNSKLDALTPDMKKLVQISARINCNGFFTFTLNTQRPDLMLAGRMFGPAIGIMEDPVTGNANGPAAVYLFEHGLLKATAEENRIEYSAIQGEAMGKPGVIKVALILQNGTIEKVQVAGSAVRAGDMTFVIAERNVEHRATRFVNNADLG